MREILEVGIGLQIWTRDCVKDVANLGWDHADVIKLVQGLEQGHYIDSEWCDNGRGALAACDAYSISLMEWIDHANKAMPIEYFVKFAINKLGAMVLTISCHLNMGIQMNSKELCPICGEGHVTAQVEMTESEYKGQKAMVPLHYQLCDVCHSDFAGAKEGKLNKRGIIAFRKSVDGLLTGDEICALRAKYKLTQAQAANLFGGGPVAFSKYENDDVAHSEAMDTLLRLVRRSESAFLELLIEKGMTGLTSAVKPGFNSKAVTTVFSTQPNNVVGIVDYKVKKMSQATAVSSTYVGAQEVKLWK